MAWRQQQQPHRFLCAPRGGDAFSPAPHPPHARRTRRYHAKRALYLAHVATTLRSHPQLAGGPTWVCVAGDPRRPALVLRPADGLSPGGFGIRLLAVPKLGTFPLPRLAPDRNNLRTAVATGGGKGGGAAAANGAKEQGGTHDGEGPKLLPTPHYNTSVLQARVGGEGRVVVTRARRADRWASGARTTSEAQILTLVIRHTH